MRIALTVAGLAAALVLIAASCAMNYTYWHTQGQTAQEGLILGGVSVAVDVLKAMLPLLIVLAVRSRYFVYAGLAAIVFVVFVAASLVSAIGFIAMSRGARRSAAMKHLMARYDLTKQELAEVAGKLERISGASPVAVTRSPFANTASGSPMGLVPTMQTPAVQITARFLYRLCHGP